MLRSSLLCALVCAFALSACDMAGQMSDAFAQSKAAAETIGKQVGRKPEIGFNFHNGSLVTVTVMFREPPAVSVAELERLARKVVVETFKTEPQQLVISFVFGKNAS